MKWSYLNKEKNRNNNQLRVTLPFSPPLEGLGEAVQGGLQK